MTFENIVQNEEIAQNKQFIHLSQCFQLYLTRIPSFNPFSHIDAFWRLCSRQLFENIVTKEEYEQFLLLQKCFQHLVIGYSFNYRDFPFFDKICSVIYCRIVVWRKGLKRFSIVSCRIDLSGKGLRCVRKVQQDDPYHHTDVFWCLWSRLLLKTLRQKQKLLVMSKFTIWHYAFGTT